MELIWLVVLAVSAWVLLSLPLAVACGRAFDAGSAEEPVSPLRTAAGTPPSRRA